MVKPVDHRKPDLSHLANRAIKLPNSRDNLEYELYEWLSEVTKVTRQPPERGVRAATVLMSSAKDSIDVLMHAPTSLAIGAPGVGPGKRKVHAQFTWGRFADGTWYVSRVAFGVDATAAALRLAQQQALKERLTDKAEAENAKHVHLRPAAFPAESHHDSWAKDVHHGDFVIKDAIETAHEEASKDAAALENPITWKDMILDVPGASAVGAVTKVGRGVEAVQKGADWASRGRTVEMAGEELRSGESRGDKTLGAALSFANLALSFTGAGPFFNVVVGSFFNMVIASDASRITKMRSRMFAWFVMGYVRQLSLADTGGPKLDTSHGKVGEQWFKWDQKYFDLGVTTAPRVGSMGNFAAQASLMHYAGEHYTDGGWGGLGFQSRNWKTIDDYITNWSPELLGRSLATQLHTTKNLTS